MEMQKLSFNLSQLSAFLVHIILCINALNFNSISVASLSAGNETDKLGLLAFKKSISEDPKNTLSMWNNSVHFCNWPGVSCSRRHPGRVTLLNLGGKKLTGFVPPHIGNLSFLREINLPENNFRGKIPQEIGRLSRLKFLNLSNNAFEGEIPSNLSYCSDLEVFEFAYNNLDGEIPFELSYLTTRKLNRFGVFANNLTGRIPLWLGNSSMLVFLSMGNNNFQGEIPVELGKLSNLLFLLVGGNHLSGTIPTQIYNLSSLLELDVGENNFQGKIPPDLGFTFPNLLGLYMVLNQFTGPLPPSLSNSSGLEVISLGGNSFTGTVPVNIGGLRALQILSLYENQLETIEPEGLIFLTSLTNCTKLRVLEIGRNRFKGELPASISNFSTSLEYLSTGTNQISGPIPDGIGDLVGLTSLLTFHNSITGKIPNGIGKLQNLEILVLSQNRISGPIPSSLGNITKLRRLYLNTNSLSGNIPPSLGNCRRLEVLHLFNNNLTGSIPREIISSYTLSFNLSQNSLTGPLPQEAGSMTKLQEFDVSQNSLTGEIPSTISNCIMLEGLLLNDNLFEGKFPPTFKTLKSLFIFDLSRNNISGEIPFYLQNLTLLQNLNLSFNNLEGEVPREGVFRNKSAFDITGNSKLCGGIKSLGLRACEIRAPNKRGHLLALKVAIPTAVSCAALLACLVFFLLRSKKIERKPSTTSPIDERFPQISYAELAQATDNFTSSNLIGQGSFGSVYKGVLGSNGMTVAVKVLNLKIKGAAKSFLAECNALKNIRHRNLIRIITACSSIDFKGEDFKALVFEFMPNGSLEELLHRAEDGRVERGDISFKQRMNIAINVASAIEYLHHHCQTSIIHGDLKPSNILLDDDMTAHVGDFGLAKFLSISLPNALSQNQVSSTGIIGTVGYVAPEYGMGSKASKQGDVYSFGILLLEMFTWRRPTDNLFKDGTNLHQFTKAALPERVMEIIEPSLFSKAEFNGRADIGECLAAVLRIGVACSMESPEERMDIRDVVVEMCKIVDNLFGIRHGDGQG